MMMVENELTTPFGIAAAKTEMNSRMTFGSFAATQMCSFLKCLFLMPVWLLETLLTASTRSREFRKKADAGLSGSTKKMTKENAIVAPPSLGIDHF